MELIVEQFSQKIEIEEMLFPVITSKIQNASVVCAIIANDDATLWAVHVTAGAKVNSEIFIVMRQSPWYPQGIMVKSGVLIRDMESLAAVLTMAIGHKVFHKIQKT